MQVLKDKKVLVAALDWGLGHATRCVPIIRRLQKSGYEVILASSGNSKKFFEGYFPELSIIDKPGYNITYRKNSSMALAIFSQLPSLVKTIIKEHLWLKKVIRKHKISEVVSDNCYGLWNKKIHSVFITHQVKIKCPKKLKFLEPLLHRIILYFIKKYDECYIPDLPDTYNYTGKLSHLEKLPINTKFIGIQSRFEENKSAVFSKSYDLVILLSGPEPQRTVFENKCFKLLKTEKIKCCIIRGLPGTIKTKENTENITWLNHLPDNELKSILQHSKKIVCRSGYSTIMDLVELKISAMLVPTPGQTEQEYLALYNNNKDQFEMMSQEKLSLKDLLREVKRPLMRHLAPNY